ncbi:MAG TPA: hypothetical protein VKT99_16995 [Xanthobacteraceae bacterium]|jgi:hypothetical protein|nr:hypothetical protein [Xanthobacteraceae bacterium]
MSQKREIWIKSEPVSLVAKVTDVTIDEIPAVIKRDQHGITVEVPSSIKVLPEVPWYVGVTTEGGDKVVEFTYEAGKENQIVMRPSGKDDVGTIVHTIDQAAKKISKDIADTIAGAVNDAAEKISAAISKREGAGGKGPASALIRREERKSQESKRNTKIKKK